MPRSSKERRRFRLPLSRGLPGCSLFLVRGDVAGEGRAASPGERLTWSSPAAVLTRAEECPE